MNTMWPRLIDDMDTLNRLLKFNTQQRNSQVGNSVYPVSITVEDYYRDILRTKDG